MSATKKLAYNVHLEDEDGTIHVFGPDSESIPGWARKAITNPSAWGDGDDQADPEPEPPADPGGDPAEPTVTPYAKWLKADLQAEVDQRNADRDDDLIEVGGNGTVKDLAAALDADDASDA